VEAPGAAPGSEWFIATAIYFHSRQAGALNIGGKSREKQSPQRPFRLRTTPSGWNKAEVEYAEYGLALRSRRSKSRQCPRIRRRLPFRRRIFQNQPRQRRPA